jgi:hypothetical protein
VSGFEPGPAPSHGIPGMRPGQIITSDHPAWHDRHNPEVWGELAEPGTHNPLHDDLKDAGPNWGDGSTHGYWSHLAEEDPAKHAAAVQAMHEALPKLHPVINISSHALHRVLDDREVRSAFSTGTTGATSGGASPSYLGHRREAEFAHFRYPDDHPHYARPVYGTLTDDPSRDFSASSYGEHSLVLSRPALAHRTTWTSSDSLNEVSRVRATSVTDPHLRSVLPLQWMAKRFDHGMDETLSDHNERPSYLEAQFHGGVHLGHVHYAILRSPHSGAAEQVQEIGKRLSDAGISWRHSAGEHAPGRNLAYDNARRQHRGVLMAHEAIVTGAFGARSHSKIIWHQGYTRFIVELAAPGPRGLPMGQVADVEWGVLYPPQPVDSILARGYWEPVPHPMDAGDVLARVRPVG